MKFPICSSYTCAYHAGRLTGMFLPIFETLTHINCNMLKRYTSYWARNLNTFLDLQMRIIVLVQCNIVNINDVPRRLIPIILLERGLAKQDSKF